MKRSNKFNYNNRVSAKYLTIKIFQRYIVLKTSLFFDSSLFVRDSRRRKTLWSAIISFLFITAAFPTHALTATQVTKLLASDGASNDYFGFSVSVSGDTAIIGAYEDDDKGSASGSAYVFVRDGAGNWTQQAKLLASDGAAQDYFGASVSVSGDTAVIGALWDDDKGIDSGSAYVFVRDGAGNWTQQAKLLASDGAAQDYFGTSVSASGDTAIIGANEHDDKGASSGSAYVFVRDGAGNWTQQAEITASDGADGDNFGFSVSVMDNTAIIGAYEDDDKGTGSGSAYVFVRDGAGNWTQQAKLLASDGAVDDSFGFSVSVMDNTAIIGAYEDDDKGARSGSAYVFVRDGAGNWTQQAKLLASDGAADDVFGSSVSVSGDTSIVGAEGHDDNGDLSGSAYVFVRDGAGNWTQQAKLLASDGAAGDGFGQSVSVSGDTVVIGGAWDDDKGVDSGSAYVFDLTTDDDSDGVDNTVDTCPSTPAGEVVDATGCSINQLCPCTGPLGSTSGWRNHGQYVSTYTKIAQSFVTQGLLTEAQKDALVSKAAQSNCGKK